MNRGVKHAEHRAHIPRCHRPGALEDSRDPTHGYLAGHHVGRAKDHARWPATPPASEKVSNIKGPPLRQAALAGDIARVHPNFPSLASNTVLGQCASKAAPAKAWGLSVDIKMFVAGGVTFRFLEAEMCKKVLLSTQHSGLRTNLSFS
jgi:hypothetical protein